MVGHRQRPLLGVRRLVGALAASALRRFHAKIQLQLRLLVMDEVAQSRDRPKRHQAGALQGEAS